MKLQPGKKRTIRGNVILICVLFSFVLGITIASYLSLVKSQYLTTIRSHDWNAGMVLAEAGIEEGMAFINKYAGDYGNSSNWADTANADGWNNINGNVYHVQRILDPTLGYYDVWVTNNINSISVCAVGSAFWDQQPVTAQTPSAAPGVATSGTDLPNIVRQVLVQATNDPLFAVAMASTGAINLNGYSLSADSFDSGDPNHSAWYPGLGYGFYAPGVRKADGFLATDGNILNVGAPGNTLIYGSVSTGPGGETNLMQNGSVGDTTWVPTPGIQPGHAEDDMNVVFQNVSLPSATPSQIGPITMRYTPPASGYYEDSESSGLLHSLTVDTTNVVFYLPNGVDYNSGSGFEPGDGNGPGFGNGSHHSITVTNGSAILYIDQNFDLGTSGNIVNATGDADDLYIYGCTNLTSLNLSSVSNFVGAIYAPQADLVLGNPGFTTVFTGSVIAKSITLNGNVQVHYDENLRRVGPTRAYVPVSWTEF